MIKPIEFAEVRRVTLSNGDTVSNADVWSMLTAARDGNLERVKELTQQSPALIKCEYNYTPPIHFAVREGHLEVTRFLLDHGRRSGKLSHLPFQDSRL